jgi:tRNA(Arg) A34 adenosine deaminase TadA
MNHEDFMQRAVELSLENIRAGKGGPFWAVVVKDWKIIWEWANHVTSENDPTAHAEIVAIRDACKKLGTFQLDDCIIYTSSEPCPMCMAALYRARPKAIYFANTIRDAAKIWFDDSFIYEELEKKLKDRSLHIERVHNEKAIKVFNEWEDKQDKIEY